MSKTITIIKNQPLQAFNTFKIAVLADYFISIQTLNELKQLLSHPLFQANRNLFLGGGSNVLFKDNFQGMVVKIDLKGICHLKETNEHVWLKVAAGENWHDFLLYCVKHNYSGIENLAYIPGSVGAAPVQNIGAYGVEVKDCLVEVEGVDIQTGQFKAFEKSECELGYRDSIFKHALKNKFIISHVTFKLNKQPLPQIEYGEIRETLHQLGIKKLSTQAICDVIIYIRKKKLPEPDLIPNAGSFFKNPFILKKQLENLQQKYPDIPHFPVQNDQFKIPAAWLIEKAGWKGKQIGNAATHTKQALVIVNKNKATGQELVDFSRKIQSVVYQQFHIQLETEVTIV